MLKCITSGWDDNTDVLIAYWCNLCALDPQMNFCSPKCLFTSLTVALLAVGKLILYFTLDMWG